VVKNVTRLFVIPAVALLVLVFVTNEWLDHRSQAAGPAAEIAQVEARLTALEGKVPDQAIVMTHVAYHFANVWFAGKEGNWPLADFYLGEVRDNLKWAVRLHPVRDGPGGQVNVAGIAESVDNTQLDMLARAIHEGRGDAFVRAYDETLSACYACHEAIGKPYLRPRRPTSPEARMIRFGDAASRRP
jgi:hypothetical protein